MQRGRPCVRQFTELHRVRIMCDLTGKQRGGKNGSENSCGDCAEDFPVAHSALSFETFANEFAATVIIVTSKVRFMINGRSRLSAACHASCPIPGESQSASIGMAAPKAMLKETPRSANRDGATEGRTCRKMILACLIPRARAASM